MPPSTASATQIGVWTRKTTSSDAVNAASAQARLTDAPRNLRARATSAPGRSSTSEAATSRSQSPTPSAGSSRAIPSSGSERTRRLVRGRTRTVVPLLGELTEACAVDTQRVSRVQPHARPEGVVPAEERPCAVLRPGREGGDARACRGVVLAPVAVPAPPHLVDPALRNPGAELRLVVDDRCRREVLDGPAGLPKAKLEIHFFRVEEELLVEQADLVERLPSEHERGAHHPGDRARGRSARLRHAELSQRDHSERGDRRARKPPRRILVPPVWVDDARSERRHARIRVEARDQGGERPVVGGR